MSNALTGENLRKLQEQYNRVLPLAMEQRVIRWLQSSQMANADPSTPATTQPSTSASNLASTGLFDDGMTPGRDAESSQAMAAAVAAAGNYYYQGHTTTQTAQADLSRYMQSLQGKSAATTAQMMSNELSNSLRQTSNPMLRNPSSPMNLDASKKLGRSGSNGVNGSPLMSTAPKEKDRGRLCCYLKVEVGGLTQMLPIHEVCKIFCLC
jgi:hypothetical protein